MPAVTPQNRPHNLADRLAALRAASGTTPQPLSVVEPRARLVWPANPVMWPAYTARWLARVPRGVPRLH